MKANIHPEVKDCVVTCACGATFTTKSTKEVLDHGAKVYELLKQKQYDSMDVYDQVIQLFTAKHRFIKEVDIENTNNCWI